MVKLSQFKFVLPQDLIAKRPADFRDDAKLMVVHRETGKIEHRIFRDFVEYFNEEDVVVVNNTKVFPAKLYGNKEKTGAEIEVFLLRELNPETRLWDVLVDPARKIRVGNKLYFGEQEHDQLVAEVVDNTTSRGRTIRFVFDGDDEVFYNRLSKHGLTPLPDYIKRKPRPSDAKKYQTIYAKHKGAIIAPAAGMHISKEVLKWFEIKGVDLAEVTLHIGMGSFRPIEVEDLSKHKMDSEAYEVNEKCVNLVNRAKEKQKRICAVGTSTLRALESSVTAYSKLKASKGWTEKFIYPPYDFEIANSLLTNFHAPQSPFFITASTFVGLDLMKEVYAVAIKKKYRFLDFGDAMLII